LAADKPLPTLIVCPATLVGHWPYEITKFVGEEVLRPLQYHGTATDRAALQNTVSSYNVVVMSYEALRSDSDWASSIKWNYCVLDEGHMIRNPTSKVAQACRRIDARHRLILTGTPIQNGVMELWALFEFLMPGFLGTQKAFNARYGKALANSRKAGRGSVEAQAGLLALEGLHRQIMPFVLRRTKDQVLSDLPPKIIQDIIVDPSPLQKALYEEFAASQEARQAAGTLEAGGLKDAGAGAPHVFQALHFLRKLCSHPLLVLDPKQPSHVKAVKAVLGPKHGAEDWPAVERHLRSDLSHSPKLAVLRELLIDSGVAVEPGVKRDEDEAPDTFDDQGGHRFLVFAQLKSLLDLVESQVLAPLAVSSLRIDGSVDAAVRFKRVQQFNADPTIPVMLLTTAVGGLGLNLTAADTVVFLEHDWNPQQDLQAMDRAHRLGQRRAVNVYRLLVRGTLEEQIMSLQRFKLDVAAAVVNTDNMSMASMDTGNVLDLFAIKVVFVVFARDLNSMTQMGGEMWWLQVYST
jgi:TATA-binding protein-associated factor